MARIAFLFMGVGSNLKDGGGAERFFADFLSDYQKLNEKHDLYFIADKGSLKSFSAIDKLNSCKNVFSFKIQNNRFKDIIEFLSLAKIVVLNRINIIQVPLYGIQYFQVLKRIDKLPAFLRPKIVITITDSFIPHYYFDKETKLYNHNKIFGPLFETVKVDAVISWYQLFKDFAEKHKIIKSKPDIYVINSRYTSKIFPQKPLKKNIIVFASRFTPAKKPLMLIDAINILKSEKFDFKDWRFVFYGHGILAEEMTQRIKEYELGSLVELARSHDLTSVFSESKCFVSTQDFENFPSLSMNEAMAAGNAIIARNVGQTDLFVKDGKNGILLKEDNAKGLAEAIRSYISNPHQHEEMARESVRLTKEVHTFDNFKIQIDSFWSKILNKK